MFKFSFVTARNSFVAWAVTMAAGAALIAGTGLLAGCPSHSSEQSSASAPVAQAAVFHGSVFGGRQPIKGAFVTVYAVAPDAATATLAATIGTAITGANGQFSIASFSPVPANGAIIYVTAHGGNSLGGDPSVSSNAAIYLMTIAGAYCSGGDGCNFPGFVNVNELTTVAAVYSAGNFFGAAGITGPGAGQAQAAKTFLNLVDPATGTARVPGTDEGASCTGSGDPVNCEALRRMDTLANIAAFCVNQQSAGAAACTNLFSAATPSGGTTPSLVLYAMKNIADVGEVRNQGTAIFNLGASATPIYAPALASAPRAWTLALRFTGGGLNPSPAVAAAQAQARLAAYTGPEASDFAPSGSGAELRLAPQSSVSLLENHATLLGAHTASAPIKLTFGLKLRNVAALKHFLRDVADPASPTYRHFLTPQQFTALYGPSASDVATVTDWLQSRGIRVLKVSSNRTLIHTEASTGAYEQALGIHVNDYRMNGREFYSTTDSPTLPRAVAGRLTGILGLNHGVQMHPHSHIKSLPLAFAARGSVPSPAAGACSTPIPDSTNYFNPCQIQQAYDWPSVTDTANGAGVTIAIVTAASKLTGGGNFNGPALFWSAYGLPAHAITTVAVGGPPASTAGQAETVLDVEWSGAMAPGAAIRVYITATPSLLTATTAYNQVVTDNLAQVMTTSWGVCDAQGPHYFVQTDEPIFLQAAAQGISMFAAAGDHGSGDNCFNGTNNNADYPSSSQWITSANGTVLSIADTSGTYWGETAWIFNSPLAGWGTGGGVSQIFAEPFWQVGNGVPQNGHRNNSDLSLNAGSTHPYVTLDYTASGPSGPGYYYFLAYGTSAVAPMLAGMFAVGVSHQPGLIRLGQSNEQIYNDANAHYATDFRDVTSGCNGWLPGTPGGSMDSCAGTGWDHPTGWGSPKAANLLQHLGVQGPAALAVDKNGNIWVVNYEDNTLSEFDAQGTPVAGSPFGSGDLDGPVAVVADGASHIWVANHAGGNLAEFDADNGSFLTSVPASAPTALAAGVTPGIVWTVGEHTLIKVNATGSSPLPTSLTSVNLDDPVGVAAGTSPVGILVLIANHANGSFCAAQSLSLSGLNCFSASALSGPVGIAVSSGVSGTWLANNNQNSVTVFDPSSASTSVTGAGLDGPMAIAVDSAGDAWIANGFGHSISAFAADYSNSPPTVTAISPPAPATSLQGGYAGAGLAWPRGIAIDAAGNIWTTSNAPNDRGLVEFIGLAAPAHSP